VGLILLLKKKKFFEIKTHCFVFTNA